MIDDSNAEKGIIMTFAKRRGETIKTKGKGRYKKVAEK